MTRRKLRVSRWLQPCPDCAASFDADRLLVHQDCCPLAASLEDVCAADAQWFADNPHEQVRIRPVSRAELQDLTFTAPRLPRPRHVHVKKFTGGRARTFVTGGDNHLVVLDADEEAS